MEYIEYPKALYLKGVFVAVANAAEEEKMRADGYTDWAEDYATYGLPKEPGEPAAEPAPEAVAPATKAKASK